MRKKERKPRLTNIPEAIAKFMGNTEGLPANFIAEEIGGSYPAVLNHLKLMEGQGLVASYPDPDIMAGFVINPKAKLWKLTWDGEDRFLNNNPPAEV